MNRRVHARLRFRGRDLSRVIIFYLQREDSASKEVGKSVGLLQGHNEKRAQALLKVFQPECCSCQEWSELYKDKEFRDASNTTQMFFEGWGCSSRIVCWMKGVLLCCCTG